MNGGSLLLWAVIVQWFGALQRHGERLCFDTEGAQRIVNQCIFQRETLFFDSLMQADFNCNFLKLIICGISYIYDDFYLIFPGKSIYYKWYFIGLFSYGICVIWQPLYFSKYVENPPSLKKSFAIILGEMYPVRLCLYILPGAFRHDDSGLLAGPST